MNDAEELVKIYNDHLFTVDELFIHLFGMAMPDFDMIGEALPEALRDDFYRWAKQFCEGGGTYIMAESSLPIGKNILEQYEQWARARGKWDSVIC